MSAEDRQLVTTLGQVAPRPAFGTGPAFGVGSDEDRQALVAGVQGALSAAEQVVITARERIGGLRSDLCEVDRDLEAHQHRDPRAGDLDDVARRHREVRVVDTLDQVRRLADRVVDDLDEASRHVRRANGALGDLSIADAFPDGDLGVLMVRAQVLEDVLEAARPMALATRDNLDDARAAARMRVEAVIELPPARSRDEVDLGVVRASQDARHLQVVVEAGEVSATRAAQQAAVAVGAAATSRLVHGDRLAADASTSSAAPSVSPRQMRGL